MKELSIEQKAKRYDEALERAIDFKNGKAHYSLKPGESIVNWIFPELKESEDERIRKWIIGVLSTYEHDRDLKNAALAWLEQGEPTDINPSEFDLRLNKLLKQFETLPKEELANCLSFYLNVVQNDGTYKADEKKGEQKHVEWHREDEQNLNACLGYIPDEFLRRWLMDVIHVKYDKPADKVEPKFHVDDYVVDNCDNVWKIEEILNQFYILKDIEGGESRPTIEWTDNTFHLWTIQDAKTGDVLASELCDSIILFKGINDDNNIDFYCDYDFSEIDVPEYWFSVNNGQHYGSVVDSEDFHPATKEQRNTLFEKMKEAGYKWDAKSKELKKIEQKPIWNNRDENYIKSAIEMIMHCIWNSYRGLYKEDIVEWLKSLKYRFAENNEELN